MLLASELQLNLRTSKFKKKSGNVDRDRTFTTGPVSTVTVGVTDSQKT